MRPGQAWSPRGIREAALRACCGPCDGDRRSRTGRTTLQRKGAAPPAGPKRPLADAGDTRRAPQNTSQGHHDRRAGGTSHCTWASTSTHGCWACGHVGQMALADSTEFAYLFIYSPHRTFTEMCQALRRGPPGSYSLGDGQETRHDRVKWIRVLGVVQPVRSRGQPLAHLNWRREQGRPA